MSSHFLGIRLCHHHIKAARKGRLVEHWTVTWPSFYFADEAHKETNQ